ncbi:hypothetical protein QE177_03510 [Arsenophonus sp. aPb]|uniref:hypothetical protein n=1 Tax=Arsenophonus sp. aPb TaxID=3041619 RepID=UPI00246937E4|nr:hypothetical protein [Arsenophonus sp. aPb]WGL98976.1 hypothetical protein QE177_03510 [Arsenophonus sp. aPb]
MQKDINNLSIIDNVLLKKEILTEHTKAFSIIEKSENYANVVVNHAVKESDRITKEAFLIGYKAGLKSIIDNIICYFKNSDDIYHAIQQKVLNQVNQCLIKIIDDEKLVAHFINSYLASFSTSIEEDELIIIQPKLYKKLEYKIINSIQFKQQNIIFDYHSENYFLIKYKDNMIRFEHSLILEHINLSIQEKYFYKEMIENIDQLIDNLSPLGKKYENSDDE